jgi:L-ascorbate metabolism protein UlaG (beta-lactamase superfamily)
VTGFWIREAKVAPVRELFAQHLSGRQVAFIYFGWAGILMRSRDCVVAFDLCEKNLKRSEVRDLRRLDVQCYSHTHWDHWHPPLAKAILKQTGAPIVVEPAIVEQRGKLPASSLTPIRPGEPIEVGDLTIEGVVGIHPRPITLFRVKAGEVTVFHGGDSGYVPLRAYSADIAFVPTGAPSPSCTPESAAAMVADLGARFAVAMHGSQEQVNEFEQLATSELRGVRVFAPGPCELIAVDLRQ